MLLTATEMQWQQLTTPDLWRPFFVLAGLWFLVFMIPTVIWLPEPEPLGLTESGENLVVVAFRRLWETLQSTSRYRSKGTANRAFVGYLAPLGQEGVGG